MIICNICLFKSVKYIGEGESGFIGRERHGALAVPNFLK